jgi:TolA-binding protein
LTQTLSKLSSKGPAATIVALLILLSSASVYADEANDMWDLANGLYIRGETYYSEAAGLYRDFIQSFPRDSRIDLATFRLAEIYRKKKEFEQALILYHNHEKFKESPIRSKVDFRIGQMYYFLQKYDEAEVFLAKTFKTASDTTIKNSTGYYLGKVYFDTHRFDKAAQILRPTADDKANPFHPFANYFLAESLSKTGQKQEAAQRYELVSKTGVSVAAESVFKAANLCAGLTQYEKSHLLYLRVIDEFPKSQYVSEAALGAIISLYNNEKYKQVEETFQKLSPLLDEKTKPPGLIALGNSLFDTKRYPEAIKIFESITQDFPKSAETEKARYKICWSHFLNKNYSRAVACALKLIELYPENSENPSIMYLLAESYYKQGVILEAINRYQSILDTTSASTLLYQKAFYKKAVCLFDQNSFDQAARLFSDFARTFPDNRLAAEALTQTARSQIEIGEYNDAAKVLEEFLEKFPDHDLGGDVMYQLGLVYAAVDNFDSLIAVYLNFEQLFPDDPRISEARHWLGTAFEEKQDTIKALEYYELALAGNATPQLVHRTQYRLAQIYHKSGRFSESAGMIYHVIAADTQVFMPSETLIWAAGHLLAENKYDQSILLYQTYTEKYSTKFKIEKAFFGLGEAYFKQEMWDKALENYRLAMEQNGEWKALAQLKAGISLVNLGDTPNAIEHLQKAARSQLSAIESQAYFQLGQIYFKQAQSAEGETREKHIEKALQNYLKVEILYRTATDRAEAMLKIGQIWQERQNTDEARRQYQRLIKEYPDTEQAKAAAKKLLGKQGLLP